MQTMAPALGPLIRKIDRSIIFTKTRSTGPWYDELEYQTCREVPLLGRHFRQYQTHICMVITQQKQYANDVGIWIPHGWEGLWHSRVPQLSLPPHLSAAKPIKSLDLALETVHLFTSPGSIGLDPAGGTGTFAIASWLLGRSCVSVEIDPEIHQIALRRFQNLKNPVSSDVDCRRIAAHIMKYPENLKQIFSFLTPLAQKRVASGLTSLMAQQEKFARAAVMKFLVCDATGDRKYLDLIKGLYEL